MTTAFYSTHNGVTTPRFYFADADALAAVPHELVPCPGHVKLGAKAVRFLWPAGSVLVSRPTADLPGAAWRVQLPDGQTIQADMYTLHAHLRGADESFVDLR